MKISVVIPVYNAAPYLKACLDSVIAAAQRLNEADETATTEVICVDDGSTDAGGAMLDSYSATFNRPPSTFSICVQHRQNAGASAARNAGMALATGDLVTFLDSDDTYDPRALEVLSGVWRKTGAEVIRFGCNTVGDHTEDVPLAGNPSFGAIDLDGREESPLRRCSLGWASAISARLAKSVAWPALTHCEDPLFILRCMKMSQKNVFVDGKLANYLIRPDSAARTVSLKIVAATCRYLVTAYDECAALPGFAKSHDDTCAFLAGFLDGPLAKCGRYVALEDRVAAEAAVRTARNLLAVRDPAFSRFACCERHDFIFALGSACTATDMLRRAGLQFESFPLDWIGFVGVPTYADYICSDFTDFLSIDRLRQTSAAGDGRHAHYVDRRYGTVFWHDFPVGIPLEESFPAVRTKYERRIARFLRHLREAKSVLIVWIGDFRDEILDVDASDAALVECLDRLEQKFPGTHFSMLVFDQAPRGAQTREIRIPDGRIRRIALDYRDWAKGPESWDLRIDCLFPYLGAHAVTDYRTSQEKRSYSRMLRQKRYEQLKARSRIELLLVECQYRIFRHLQKRLIRKGVRL